MKILKFYAPWCGPCKQQGEFLSKVTGVEVQDVNIEESMNDIGHKNRYKITISYMINNTSKINTTSVIVEGRDFYG
jgi:thiol-disulfide isomerase/thioredoxin